MAADVLDRSAAELYWNERIAASMAYRAAADDTASFPAIAIPAKTCDCRQWPSRRSWIVTLIIVIAIAFATGSGLAVTLRPPPAFPRVSAGPVYLDSDTQYVGARILNAAETRLGDWYVYGADGPSTFDCSGLVDWAATSIGEQNWPRDTYGIADQIGSRFTITDHPQRGDLALWGSVSAPYHVEIVTIWSQTTFGTEDPTYDGRVTWHYDGWFEPSFYLHINY